MFRYDTEKDNNIDRNTWKIKYTSDKSSRRACSSKKFSVCKTPMHRSIDIQLKNVRLEKNKEYLHKVNIAALFPRNNVMLQGNLDNHTVSKSDIIKKYKTSFRKTDNNYWLPGTLSIVGDSIVKELDKKRLSMNIEIELEFLIEMELETYVKLSTQSSRKNPSFWNKRCQLQRLNMLQLTFFY